MADTKTKEEVNLDVQEEATGGAVVQLPDGFDLGTLEDGGEGAGSASAAPSNEAAPEGTVADDPADVDHPDDTDAVREAKRARRRAKKTLARETSRQRDAELAALRRENQALRQEVDGRLSRVESVTRQQVLQNMDRAIEDGQVRVEYAKMKLTEATAAGDAAAIVEAQEALQDAKAAVGQLRTQRQTAEQNAQRQAGGNGGNGAGAPAGPDLVVQRHANTWAERNSWFDPNPRTTDMDSRIARQVDQALSQEGFDPRSADYWEEMDSRLRKYLPHRYTAAASNGNSTPRNTVASAGREVSSASAGTGRQTFTLSPERVKAIKDAGAWGNPERRNRMIKRYMEYDRAHRS